MAKNEFVKVRKDHSCSYCGNDIKKGNMAKVYAERTPRFDENDNQIGISYIRYYLCFDEERCKILNY